MIEGIFLCCFYTAAFIGLLAAVEGIWNVCEYIYSKKQKHCPIAEDVRCVKIKPDDWVSHYFAGEFYPEDEKPKRSDKPIKKFVM